MAEIKLSDLPLITEEEFTANDRFVMVNDGAGAAMTKTVFDSWIANNVQGEQGEQGVAGRDGVNGTKGRDGAAGANGLSAYQIAVSLGYKGTQTQWISSLKGSTGAKGTDGFNGWSPIIRTVPRGSESVLQIYDWSGGTGSKPTTLGYVGSTGLVTNIENATNIKGAQGIQGKQGDTGEQGKAGVGGRTVQSIVFNPDLSVTVTFTDDTTVASKPPPVRYGWGTYKDGQYVSGSVFTVPINTQNVLPNTAAVKIEKLPTGVTAFYNPVTQKYLMTDINGWYDLRIRFKVVASSQPSYINLSMSKDTSEIPYSEDRSLRGDSTIQDLSFSTQIYGDEALASNGMTIRVKAFDRAVSIYNIEVMIAKLI